MKYQELFQVIQKKILPFIHSLGGQKTSKIGIILWMPNLPKTEYLNLGSQRYNCLCECYCDGGNNIYAREDGGSRY